MKPQIPAGPFVELERIPVDETDGSPFGRILRVATFAADDWTLGPDGPGSKPQTPATVTRMQIREALLHLLELGFIDIDMERLDAMEWIPCTRGDSR